MRIYKRAYHTRYLWIARTLSKTSNAMPTNPLALSADDVLASLPKSSASPRKGQKRAAEPDDSESEDDSFDAGSMMGSPTGDEATDASGDEQPDEALSEAEEDALPASPAKSEKAEAGFEPSAWAVSEKGKQFALSRDDQRVLCGKKTALRSFLVEQSGVAAWPQFKAGPLKSVVNGHLLLNATGSQPAKSTAAESAPAKSAPVTASPSKSKRAKTTAVSARPSGKAMRTSPEDAVGQWPLSTAIEFAEKHSATTCPVILPTEALAALSGAKIDPEDLEDEPQLRELADTRAQIARAAANPTPANYAVLAKQCPRAIELIEGLEKRNVPAKLLCELSDSGKVDLAQLVDHVTSRSEEDNAYLAALRAQVDQLVAKLDAVRGQ
jgi:hypothetical protein